MKKILSKLFKRYEEDDYAAYLHSGVGYAGVDYSPDRYGPITRKKHKGVGFGGIYD
jgi:hypothetical protein